LRLEIITNKRSFIIETNIIKTTNRAGKGVNLLSYCLKTKLRNGEEIIEVNKLDV
jgi:hypothetical protein